MRQKRLRTGRRLTINAEQGEVGAEEVGSWWQKPQKSQK